MSGWAHRIKLGAVPVSAPKRTFLRGPKRTFSFGCYRPKTDKRGSVASVLFPHTVLSYQHRGGGALHPTAQGRGWTALLGHLDDLPERLLLAVVDLEPGGDAKFSHCFFLGFRSRRGARAFRRSGRHGR